LLTRSSLAMHEMRLILASVLLHFELELVDETEDWMAQETYVVWAKIPLHIKLKAVRK
jgi:cytochrome P450